MNPVHNPEDADPRHVPVLKGAPSIALMKIPVPARASQFLPLIFLVFSVVLPTAAHSQNHLSFDRITQREGLSSSSVVAMCQDVCGAMWFGTDEGAERYDGYGFRVFKIGMVFALCSDERGYVWIGTPTNGIYCYDIAEDTLISLATALKDPCRELHRRVATLYLDREGILWVGLMEGLARFDTRKRQYLSDLEPSVPKQTVTSIEDDQAGNLWLVSCCVGIVKFEKGSGQSRVYQYDLGSAIRPHLAFGRDGKLWLSGGPAAGLVCFDTVRHEWSKFLFHGVAPNASDVLVDDVGRVWVATATEGLKIFDPRSGAWEEFRHRSSNPQTLTSDRIGVIYRDIAGNFWFGTRNGVSKLARWRKQFWALPHDTDDPNSPPKVPIRSICEDRTGNLWIASWGDGVRVWNRRAGSFNVIDGIGSYVNVVHAARSGWVWIGTENPGCVTAINPATGQRRSFRHEERDSLSIPSGSVRSLFEDPDGSIWVGTTSFGIGRIDARTGTCRRLKPLIHSGDGSSVKAFYRDKAGRLWVSVGDMVVEVIGKAQGARALAPDGNLQVWERAITAMHEDGQGRFWVGTPAGFGVLDRSTGKLTYLRHDDQPYQASATYGIMNDDRGNLWLLAPRGISRFRPETNEFRDFGYADGFPPTNLAINAVYGTSSYCRTNDGFMVFGTGEGIVLFHPDSIQMNPIPPNVILTECRVSGSPVRLRMSTLSAGAAFEFRPIELLHFQNSIAFEFAALDYAGPSQNSYAYRLEGSDDTWSSTSTRRRVEYANLAPGSYVFRVKASNNDGVWNEEGAFAKITILPPWWMTWWFRALIALCALGVIVLIIKSRVRRAVAEEKLRMNIARDLHDDLSGTLSSITFYSEAVTRSEGEQLRHYIGQISESAREAKEKITDIIWSVDPHHDDGNDFLARCERYASDMLDSKGILHEVKIDKSLPSALAHDLRQNLWLIFKEIVVNLVRHSCCSHATISITRMKNTLVINISDNGKGFDVAASHRGNGLNNIRNRAEAIGAAVALNTAPGGGTQWRIEARM